MITNNFLNELAKAVNGESYVSPGVVAFSSTTKTLSPSDTSLGGELDYDATSGSRVTNEVTFNALRSGTIVSAGGDRINSLGLLDTSTGTLLAEALVPSVLHTSTYDLDVNWKIIIERK